MSQRPDDTSKGWKPDPDDPSRLRFWDGAAWTGMYHAAPEVPPEQVTGAQVPQSQPKTHGLPTENSGTVGGKLSAWFRGGGPDLLMSRVLVVIGVMVVTVTILAFALTSGGGDGGSDTLQGEVEVPITGVGGD